MLNPVQPRSGRIPKFGGEKEDGWKRRRRFNEFQRATSDNVMGEGPI